MCWKEKIQWQSVTNGNGLRKEHVLRSPFLFLDKVLHFFFMVICNSLNLLLKSLPQKVVLNSITARFCLRSYDFDICLPFFKHLSRDYEKTTITAMYHGR
jgi:hypothetical protein